MQRILISDELISHTFSLVDLDDWRIASEMTGPGEQLLNP